MTNHDPVRKNFDDANLSGTDLSEADLANASLRRSKLKDANLRDATLAESDLHGARLDHADVTGADLRDADLTDASLHGVNLGRAAAIEGVRLAGAKGVDEKLTHAQGGHATELHMAQAAEEIERLNQQIAETARAIFVPAAESTEQDRQATLERVAELRVRRNLREERLLSLVEEWLRRTP